MCMVCNCRLSYRFIHSDEKWKTSRYHTLSFSTRGRCLTPVIVSSMSPSTFKTTNRLLTEYRLQCRWRDRRRSWLYICWVVIEVSDMYSLQYCSRVFDSWPYVVWLVAKRFKRLASSSKLSLDCSKQFFIEESTGVMMGRSEPFHCPPSSQERINWMFQALAKCPRLPIQDSACHPFPWGC